MSRFQLTFLPSNRCFLYKYICTHCKSHSKASPEGQTALTGSAGMALAVWIRQNEDVFALQGFIFQSLELFELTKAQTQKLTKAKKPTCFRFVCRLAKSIPLFLVKRSVSSQHTFGVRQCVCVFIWSKMLTAYRSPFLRTQIIQAVVFRSGSKRS